MKATISISAEPMNGKHVVFLRGTDVEERRFEFETLAHMQEALQGVLGIAWNLCERGSISSIHVYGNAAVKLAADAEAGDHAS